MGILANENSISAGGYTIERSLRFQSASTTFLSRTFTTPTDSKKWTWSGWVKRGTLGAYQCLFGGWASNTDTTSGFIEFDTNDCLTFQGWATVWRISTQVFRDPSAWYHIVVAIDTTQATANNRVAIYINGTQVNNFGTLNNPALNANTGINTNVAHNFGRELSGAPQRHFDGYMAEVNFIDGQALTPSSFGETDALTGVWVAKRYTGTYGTNGFYLKFNDGTSTTTLGQDRSGNGNNWTLTNFTRSAGVSDCWMLDVPSGNGSGSGTQPSSNYCVMNPLSKDANITLTGANLNVSCTAANTGNSFGTIQLLGGKWYFELTVNNNAGMICGMTDTSYTASTQQTMNLTAGSLIRRIDGSSSATLTTVANGDVLGFAFDTTNKTFQGFKNGSSLFNDTYTTTADYFPIIRDGAAGSALDSSINFGQRSFAYTPPSGFRALCTANLPAPTIAKGNQYMDATLWSGNSASPRAISNQASFSPDLVWIKNRSSASAYWNQLTDSVRGAGKALFSNSTNAEDTNTAFGYLSAFNSDGFSVSAGTSGIPNVNETGSTYVAWQWDAGSSTVTNTSGSITSQVRANTTAGFSIVTYTSNSGTVSTVGHGLGVAPSMLIFKNRTLAATDWVVYHQSLGNTRAVFLNLTNAPITSSTYFNNTSPTSSVFTIGSSNNLNNSTNAIVCYAFAEIAGFSKFGSYTGNGSTDGPFIYTGFQPKFILIKITSGADNWAVRDTARSPYNVGVQELYPNLSNAEGTGSSGNMDILSNGFKLRGTSNNNSGGTFIYMAFAENPFNISNAR